MQINLRKAAWGVVLGGILCAAGPAFAEKDHVRAKVTVGGKRDKVRVDGRRDNVRVGVRLGRIDRVRRVPPNIRVRGFRGNVHFRVNPFRSRIGVRIGRFSPRERALWVKGRWWHGRHRGRFGWWWWVNGAWFFYATPVYPYPDYVSETYYDEPTSEEYGDYWYYCRNPQGYYPYVQNCNGPWEPVPATPEGGYSGGGGNGDQDQYEEEGPGGPGAYDEGGPGGDEMGPPDEEGPPDEDGPPDEEDDSGPPPRY